MPQVLERKQNDLNAAPKDHDLFQINAENLSTDLVDTLLQFNKAYQLKELTYFAKLRLSWHDQHPKQEFRGLCAEVDSISGEFIPLNQQRAWGWADTRALGQWAYMLIAGRIDDADVTIKLSTSKSTTINLKQYYQGYCEHLYQKLYGQYHQNNEKIPFVSDIYTGASNDRACHFDLKPGLFTSTHIFAINAFYQYGLLNDNQEAIQLAMKFLEQSVEAAKENRIVDHLSRKQPTTISNGNNMVINGAIVDILKSMTHLENNHGRHYATQKSALASLCKTLINNCLEGHWDESRSLFSEYLDPQTGDFYKNHHGQIICDPGHAAETIGFCTELYDHLPSKEAEGLLPTLTAIASFIDDRGYSKQGVMYKHIDLISKKGCSDSTHEGVKVKTAPWWNLREMAAASLKLYALTGERAMWKAYGKAFNASYANYPNELLDGQMTKTLDADSLTPLSLHPATGNIDPMHSARSREREIESLQNLKHTLHIRSKHNDLSNTEQ